MRKRGTSASAPESAALGPRFREDNKGRAAVRRRALWLGFASLLLLIRPASGQTDPDRYRIAEQLANDHIAKYRTADFDVFTDHGDLERIRESHAKNVVVHWPDGRQTTSVEEHIDDLKAMFVYAPDTRIPEHKVEFATAEWSSVVGIMVGTFTRPMPTPDGKSIAPTGKPFRVVFSAVDHWKDGLIDEEFLFWDNLSFMRQVGLMP